VEILIAKMAGFCFGVKRAIDMAFTLSKKGGVYTYGPLIHNPQVIEKLRERGVDMTDNLDRDDIRTLLIRTHGIPYDFLKKTVTAGYDVVDATCPFVKKAQYYAKLLRKEGYQVVILGDREHPEVKGLMSYAGKDVIITDGETLTRLKKKVGIVVQTTQPIERLKRLLGIVIQQSKEIKVYNTICDSTALRLKETEELARKVDAMIVVGGKNSANTTQLAHLCRSLHIRTCHIETADEMKEEWFREVNKVGITAGASTPEWIIEDVKKRIQDIGGRSGNGT
jgi:4-hydroxy-3-methylbut-2-en-1-yl diphosphate reductase